MKRMKIGLITCCLLAGCTAYGQTVKKKLLGTYEGTIPAYRMDVGQTVVNVEPTTIRIELLDGSVIVQHLDNKKHRGTWTVDDTEKAYYVITYRLEGQAAEERLILYRKTRTMERDGFFPQPDALLTRESRR
jgi:hypothetical protein